MTYGDILSVKERLGPRAVQSDSLDVDIQNKVDDASDFVILKLEEFPTVFPDPTALTGLDKVRVDRIVNDLAAALYTEDRSMRTRQNVRDPEFERWAVVFRRRAMLELDQYIKVKTKVAGKGSSPDFFRVAGDGLGNT